MYRGKRKEYFIKKDQPLELKNFAFAKFKNLGASTVKIAGYTLGPAEETTIETGGVVISENIAISFSELGDNNLYAYVINVQKCN